MKIAIIQPRVSYYQGGGEKLTLRFILELAKAEDTIIDLYTTKTVAKESLMFTNFKKSINKRVNVIELIVPDKFKYLYKMQAGQDQSRWDTESIFFNSLIYPLLENNKPDLIWCDYIIDCLIKPWKIPSVLYLVGYPREYLNLRKAWLAQYNSIICISKNVQLQWNRLTDNGLRYCDILHTAPVIDHQLKCKKNVYINNGFNILYAGRLIERKGVQTLMMAIKDLKKEAPDLYLNILGTGPYEVELKSLAKKIGLRVNFLGHQENLSSYYANANICVFPSYEGEGLMGVVLEAMSSGACVITTTNNGNEEIINNGVNGFLVESRNIKQLAKAILFAYKNPAKIKKVGNLARVKINKEFTWEKHVAKFRLIARKLIKQHQI